MRPRTAAACVAASALIPLTVSACGSGDDNPTVTSTLTTGGSSEATATPTVGQQLNVAYANGKVTGDTGRQKVKVGTQVSIVVTSDVADEVHNHATNQMLDVDAGGTVTMTFTVPNKPGIYEVELEGMKKTLLELEING